MLLISDTLQNAFRQSFIKATERFYRRSRSFVVTTDSLLPHPAMVLHVGSLQYPRPSGNYIALALHVVQLAGHIYWWHNSYNWFPLFWYFHPNTLAWISFSSESRLLRPSRHNAQPVDLIVSNAWFAGKERQHQRFARELEWSYYYYLRMLHRQNQRNKKRLNNGLYATGSAKK